MVFHSIFLDLRKAFDALDRDLCLDILAGYGVGPRTLHILQTYWFWLQMVAKVKGHYGTFFQSNRGLTQGETFSPNIFNVVSDSAIRHQVTVVGDLQEVAGHEGMVTSIQNLSELFYAEADSSCC